ncbi:MAG: carboxymuconolactone decarboxylase family protein [Ferrovibrio sp.]|uniref:carboxymuconolactone decarboxylase family protein n=1 Tax=Ferrovibrio sp. TaxID=1917215 RepID=UPI00391DA604
MVTYPIHTPETAPATARPHLASARQGWGFVPNLLAVLAEAPVALEGYVALFGAFDRSSFTPSERQVVYLAINFDNACRYCMAGHSVLARKAGLSAAQVEALRNGLRLSDPRLEALHRFSALMVRQRGVVDPADVDAFLAAGFTRAQVLEVILGIATKVLSNYTNHIAATPLDAFMAGSEWTPPARAA